MVSPDRAPTEPDAGLVERLRAAMVAMRPGLTRFNDGSRPGCMVCGLSTGSDHVRICDIHAEEAWAEAVAALSARGEGEGHSAHLWKVTTEGTDAIVCARCGVSLDRQCAPAEATERPAQREAREPDAWIAEVAGAPERSRSFPSQKEATDHIVRCAPGGQPDRLAGRVVPLYRAPTSDHAAGEREKVRERALQSLGGTLTALAAIEAQVEVVERVGRPLDAESIRHAVASARDEVDFVKDQLRALASRPHPEATDGD